MAQSKAFKEKIRNLDIKEFIKFYQDNGISATIKRYHMDQKTIRNILKDNNVDIIGCAERGAIKHSQSIEKLMKQIPKELLYKLYVEDKLSILECQQKCGLCATYPDCKFMELFARYGIKIRNSLESQELAGKKHTAHVIDTLIKDIPRDLLEVEYRKYGLRYVQRKYHSYKIRDLLQYYGIDLNDNNQTRARRVTESALERAIAQISYEDIYNDWVKQRMPISMCMKKYTISESVLNRLLEHYGINKKHGNRYISAKSSNNQKFYSKLIEKGFTENEISREYYIKNKYKKRNIKRILY